MPGSKTWHDKHRSIYDTPHEPRDIARNQTLAGISDAIRELAKAVDYGTSRRQDHALVDAVLTLAKATREAGEANERGLDNLADSIKGLSDAVRGTDYCGSEDNPPLKPHRILSGGNAPAQVFPEEATKLAPLKEKKDA